MITSKELNEDENEMDGYPPKGHDFFTKDLFCGQKVTITLKPEGKEVKTQYLLCSCKNGILQKKRSSLENGLFQKQILLVVDSFMFVEDFSTNSSISISEGLSKSWSLILLLTKFLEETTLYIVRFFENQRVNLEK